MRVMNMRVCPQELGHSSACVWTPLCFSLAAWSRARCQPQGCREGEMRQRYGRIVEQSHSPWEGTLSSLSLFVFDPKAHAPCCIYQTSLSCFLRVWLRAKWLQSHPTLCDPMNCGPPSSSVRGILQASILEWVAMPSSRESSRPRDPTGLSWIASGFWATWEAPWFPGTEIKLT